jgi:hypothetical protein
MEYFPLNTPLGAFLVGWVIGYPNVCPRLKQAAAKELEVPTVRQGLPLNAVHFASADLYG